MSNDAPTPSDDDVVALAKAAFEHSRQDISHRGVGESAPPRELQQQPGITIDLGHKNISHLPDEVIDVIRTEIERLALSHNALTTLPLRLVECRRLRYLNVRYNAMREIPDAILELTSLEILDVSRNKIKFISPKIANLTSLKVLAIAKNKIEKLPVCLGDINSLQVLKLDGNPLLFPPPEVCTIKDNAPSPANENERDAVIATQVKRFMRQQVSKERQRAELYRLRIESSGDESWTESNPETPRPSKRANGGRFPVRPSVGNGDGFPESKTLSPVPGVGAPPIPSRSHFRVSSQASNGGGSGGGGGGKRAPMSPLAVTNGSNERNRSQSEGSGPSSHRQKRMGIYTSKASDLGSVDELRRTSHFRGFSQGIVIPTNTMANGMSGPATAVGYGDTGTVRSLANRPLSDVREHRRASRAPDIVVESAKNFLYAISQLHDCISHMVRSVKLTARPKDALRRKEDFHRRFSTTYLNVQALNKVLHKFDSLVEEDEEEAHKLSKSVYMYALRCLDSFMSISLSIAENRVELTQNANPHIMRTFLFLQQGSLIEMRNACSVLGAQFRTSVASRSPSAADIMGTVRARPYRVRRLQTSPTQRNGHHQMPPPVMLHSNDSSRTNTLTSLSAATPRSGESFSTFTPAMTRSNTLMSNFDEIDDDAQFDRVYQKLRNASDSCRASIPQITRLLREHFDLLRRELDSEHPRIKALAGLIDKSNEVQQMTIPLASRLSQMQLKDRDVRNQPDFWLQCMGFIKAWGELATGYTQQGKDHKLLSPEVKQLMKPLHRTVKEASLAINDSPWSNLTSNHMGMMGPPSLSSFTSRTQPPRFLNKSAMAANGGGLPWPNPINTSIPAIASAFSSHHYPSASHASQGSGGYITPVPATPLSAALGAAAQATVPNTPKFPTMGGQASNTLKVFDRADKLLSQTSRRI
ncbi:cell morphogenesis protein-like protein Sog2 [Dothidotthia symphoricarpi CBS 119687]|uniref:Cell morphogenesis protein-like protein Sog2 n=1 Tax=Dothidotthia symphoricarpi CBS 119687 TaxID=1392245 RepID=A0A6A6A600_9PLEO|nr:cell morphogenesis protein-like protein Sog2 [Dothidotthia symphoricarpi CBS 119687]KAF2127309.1 cell morphogenesis protein-like protein Sog2 [Dothidotthia symphoricarpi CBS 119687]